MDNGIRGKNVPLIKVEAEMLSDLDTKNNFNSSRSYIDELAKETKNYDRISRSDLKKHHQIYADYTNKDSGIDSHRDGTVDEPKVKKATLNQSDLDSHLKQNRKVIKRLNNDKKKRSKTFDTLNSVVSTDTTTSADSMVSSVDAKKLRKKLQESKELNLKIRKAIIDLLALDKIEKQKKLGILKQQRVIEIQKMKLNDALLIKRSMTNFEDPVLNREKHYQEFFEDKIGIAALEKMVFPSIVKKYDPYGRYSEPVYSRIPASASLVPNDFDQFYMTPSRVYQASIGDGDLTYEDILNVIDEVEQKDKLSGKPGGSSYYMNGQLIKGPDDVYNRHSSYFPQTSFVSNDEIDPKLKRHTMLDALDFLEKDKYEESVTKSRKDLSMLYSLSEVSLSSLDYDLANIDRLIRKSTCKRVRSEPRKSRKPRLVQWDREGILKDEKTKPRVSTKNKSEFTATDDSSSGKSFKDVVAGIMNKKKEQAPAAASTSNQKAKAPEPSKPVTMKSQDESTISKLFRDVGEKKSVNKANIVEIKKPEAIKPAAAPTAAATRPKRFFLKNLIAKKPKKNTLSGKSKSTVERKKENNKKFEDSKKVAKQVAKRTKAEEAKKKKEEKLRKKQEKKIKKSKKILNDEKKKKKADKKAKKEEEAKLKKEAAKKKGGKSDKDKAEADAKPGFFARILGKLPFGKKAPPKKKEEEDTVKEIYNRRRILDDELPGSANNLRNNANPTRNENNKNVPTPTPALNELVRKNPILSRNNSISELPKQNPLVKPIDEPKISSSRDIVDNSSRRGSVASIQQEIYRYQPQPKPEPFSASSLLMPTRPMTPIRISTNSNNNNTGVGALARQVPINPQYSVSNRPTSIDELAKQNPLLATNSNRNSAAVTAGNTIASILDSKQQEPEQGRLIY